MKMSARDHLRSENETRYYQHEQQSWEQNMKKIKNNDRKDQSSPMPIVGNDSQAKGASASCSGSQQTRDSAMRTATLQQNSRSTSGEVSLPSSHGSEASFHSPPSPKDNIGQAKASQGDDSKPVPSSPLVTPPMSSNKSPDSPRANTKTSSALPPAATPHGFHTDPAIQRSLERAPQANPPAHPKFRGNAQPVGRLIVSNSANPRHSQSPGSSPGKPRGVPHVYHDFSHASGPDPSMYVRKKTGGVTQPFPEKLHEMLNSESKDDPSSAIVSWLPHGRAFIVRRPKEFTSEIMPK